MANDLTTNPLLRMFLLVTNIGVVHFVIIHHHIYLIAEGTVESNYDELPIAEGMVRQNTWR
jgi:hypothetical protein